MITGDFAAVILSNMFTVVLMAFNLVECCMNKNFDEMGKVCEYYIEVTIEKGDSFKADLDKIRRFSKCKNRLKEKLVGIINENTSDMDCQTYYVEMIGTGCNIHIIHHVTENTKIRRKSTGSIPASDPQVSMNQKTIVEAIYEDKFGLIEEELVKLWNLKGKISVKLYHHMPTQEYLQMAMHQQVISQSEI